MRKFFGYVILIVSLLLGLMLAVLYGEAIIFTCIFFWLICIPMYSWSKYLRSTKYEFKTKIRDSLKRYIYFLFIIPMLFHIGLFYLELKEKAFIDEKYIKYELSASFIGEINFFFILLCGFLFGMRFMSDFKRKRLLNVLIICSAILFIGFSYFTFSEYRGIHEELGLISSNIKGEKNIIPYEEIESVHVVPYMSYSRRNTNFVWEIIFQVRNQNKEVYQYIDINKSNLERTFQIKDIVTEKGIPFEVREMNADTLEWFDWELDMDNLDKERYYELFQIHGK